MAYSVSSQSHGLVVAGTHPKCGKTVACAGLAGVLGDLGFYAQAVKPLLFQPITAIRKNYEQAFFDRIVPSRQPVEGFSTEAPARVSATDWQRLVEAGRKRVYPYLLESPGCVASPLRYAHQDLLDAVDLAMALEVPVLLVTAKQPDLIAALAPALSYLWSRDAALAGWLAVETAPTEAPEWESEVLYLRGHYEAPYLGEISYSPSISVETLQQGNLLRQTECGVDFLPLQQALHLLISR